MRRLLLSIILVLLPAVAGADHPVGEPDLERSRIFQICCDRSNCIPHEVEFLGEAGSKGVISVDGVEVAVEWSKFHQAPTKHTWICYKDRNGILLDSNIDCVLYPETGSLARR